MNTEHATTLSNAVRMPLLHLGAFKASDREVQTAIHAAFASGYRAVDTAAVYKNETGVGTALRDSTLPREEYFVTSKVWNDDHGYEQTLKAFEASRERVGLEYLDLYLIHWPVPGMISQTWKALEELYRRGAVRAIGVSNFQTHHLEQLRRTAEIAPMVNQVEFHPFIYDEQRTLLQYCRDTAIVMQGWAPLARARRFDDEVVRSIAEAQQRTPAQIMLRWAVQHGVVVLPKSTNPERIKANGAIWDFELSEEQMRRLDSISDGARIGPHPDRFFES